MKSLNLKVSEHIFQDDLSALEKFNSKDIEIVELPEDHSAIRDELQEELYKAEAVDAKFYTVEEAKLRFKRT